MRTWLIYTGLRLVLFVCVTGVLIVVGLNGFPLLLLGLFGSSILSLFMLKPQRDALVRAQEDRHQRKAAEKADLRAKLDGEPT